MDKKIVLIFSLLSVVLIVPFIVSAYINMSQYTNTIIIDANFSDWDSLDKISDDAGDAGSGFADEEFLVAEGSTLSVFDWNGNAMANTLNITAPSTIYAIAVGDIDGDGENDIAVSSPRNTLQFFKNISGTWVNYYNYTGCTGDYSYHLRIGNVDDDPDNEVVYACGYHSTYGNGKLVILENSSGTVSTEEIATVDWLSYYFLSLGNLDNDDYTEIFLGDESNDQFRVYEYNGSDYVNTANVSYPSFAENSLSVADFGISGDADGDGSEDEMIFCGNSMRGHLLASSSDNSYNVVWNSPILKDGNGWGFTQVCGMGDMNGDGKPDLVLGACTTDPTGREVFFEKDTMTAGEYNYTNTWNHTHQSGGPGVGSGATADIDADGIIEWAFDDGLSSYYWNNNTDPYGPPFTVTQLRANWEFAFAAGDVDNDGGSGGVNKDNFDIIEVSLANNNTNLYAFLEVNGTVDFSDSSEYYRFFVNTNNATGDDKTPDSQENLAFKYDYRVEVSNSQCDLYNSTGSDIGNCNFANNTDSIEIEVKLSDMGIDLNDNLGVVFETGNSTQRYDLSPNYADIINYKVNDGSLPNCGDGYCDGNASENCSTCPSDCISGQFSTCGDGICHGQDWNEDCNSCSDDCFSDSYTPGTCEACFKGKCDGSCHPTKETTACKDCNDPINTCCGDEVCEGTETSTNCPVDCGTVGPLDNYCCGDGVCEGDENLDNCYFDCHNCFFDWECDDDNECTTDVCNGLCEYTPVSDDTTCTGGICCSGDCVTATCSTDSECDDSESCTTDTCVSPGTCSSNCNNNWPGCGLSDSCCGPLCGSEDPDCPQQDCSACHKGVCDGSCNPAKEGPSCPDCV